MNAAQQILSFGVRLYQLVLSPAKMFIFGNAGQCRFSPSCSEYALEAVSTHGAVKGSWLSLKRICRCHPWGGCGCDPVPEKKSAVHSPQSKVAGSNGLFTFHVSRFTSATSLNYDEACPKSHPSPASH
jgi:putative membrane protein insertion efficiency factor